MIIKMLRKNFLRNKSISVVLGLFISLSALLVASGSNMLVELTHSLNALFAQSKAPHFVQMHAGELDHEAIEQWTASNKLVEQHQIAEMVKVEGINLFLGGGASEQDSVMDHYFVKQNNAFDVLLNLKSEAIRVDKGEIAIPIYYMQHKNVQLGDRIVVSNQSFQKAFTVVDFVRDVQMNPSIIHSKRFVVNETDLNTLKKQVGEVEYLIEFRLADASMLNQFRNDYQSSNLPRHGPSIDYPLFKSLNAITDGILAAVIILVSLLLSVIAILCLRFTLLAAIEEDYREIGIMKAIGIWHRDIKKIYLLKYAMIAAVASVVGYLASFFVQRLFTANIMLYIGTAPKSMMLQLIPFIAVGFIFMIVVLFCILTLRMFNRISAVEALRSETNGKPHRHKRLLSLSSHKRFTVTVFLGLRDVLVRFKMYRMLLLVFMISTFIIVVPIHLLHTIQSPGFNTYMGIERSDLRIDLQYSEHITDDFNKMVVYLEDDPDIQRFAPVMVQVVKVLNSEGVYENMTVETGDFVMFPLEYVQGAAPVQDNEIALSYLNGKEMNKKVGDKLRLLGNGREQEMVVSGIYQDVTNGGRTAKAVLPFDGATALRYKVSLDVRDDVNLAGKAKEYTEVFYPAKVTDLEGYLSQTLGNTIDQLKRITTLAVVIALLVSVLITSLFMRMVAAKDAAQIAIKKSIGFSLQAIRMEYLTRALFVLGIGITAGTIVSNTLGERAAGTLLSFMGASQIRFVIDPLQSYVLIPLVFMLVVTMTALLSIVSINKTSIADMNAE
ncbi:ABC transporter permease [Paenibacillaceae bacterium]|nr:ABC transporter permease [Paenibacillaceae bacterium]